MCVTMIVSITMKCSAGEPCVLVFIHCVCLTGPNLKSLPETLMAIPLFSEGHIQFNYISISPNHKDSHLKAL